MDEPEPQMMLFEESTRLPMSTSTVLLSSLRTGTSVGNKLEDF
jgi:hypothetical protein